MFMAVFSVFSLASCSTVSTNDEVINKKTVLKVGDVSLSRSDVVNSFYTYYQNNSSYFSYYDNETIEESFYTWAIIKEVINQKSATALYDADTNPNGYIVFTAENQKNVLKNTYDYIYNQISSYEKNVYKSKGYAEENYPSWLATEEEEAAETTFEAYVSTMPTEVSSNKSEAVKKLTEEQVLAYVNAEATSLKTYLFEHLVEKDADGNETRKLIKDTIAAENRYVEEIKLDRYIPLARAQAYIDYQTGLVNNANSDGRKESIETLLNEEIVRVYDAYYESEISTLLQKYFLDDYLINGEETPLTEKAIAEAFLKDYYSDFETYQFENSYITTMTSQDGASLVLYHYNGQNYFFTVQHILIKNDEHLTEKITEIPGYDASGKYDFDATGDGSVAGEFLKKRQEMTDNYFMAAVVNEKALKDSIAMEDESTKFANYYYYDADKTSDNDGYIKLVKVDNDGDVKYFVDANKDDVKDDDETTEIDVSKVLYLSSDEDIENCYKANYLNWTKLAKEYRTYVLAENATEMKKIEDANKDMAYVLETVKDMTIAEKSELEINQKIASYLFVELEWIFSSDSLGNKLSNKMGYVMSNYPDEHGSWVSEFAIGARDLLVQLQGTEDSVQEGIESILSEATVDASKLTTKIISTYGYHIIKVEDIFACGSSVIDVDAIKTSLGAQTIDLNNKAHLDAVIKAMNETYVCSASNQTIYDYYFDELYTGFVGSSWVGDAEGEISGTYFLKLEYEWLYELYKTDQVEYIDKIGYEELLESVS